MVAVLTEVWTELPTELPSKVLPIRPLFAPYPLRPTARRLPRRSKNTASHIFLVLANYTAQLLALKTVLVNDDANAAPAAIVKTAHHSPTTIHLYIGFRAHNISGK